MHPAQIGQTNNYTKLRNFKKFHTDIHRTMMDSNKAKQNGRNAIHKHRHVRQGSRKVKQEIDIIIKMGYSEIMY